MAVLTVGTCIANLEILITFGGVAVSASEKVLGCLLPSE
jgi:hypothetical protein